MRRLILAIGLAIATLAAGAAQAETVAVTAARLLDVASGKYVDNPVVVIVDGRITAVGRQGDVAIPTGATRKDLPGLTLLPGLIDMHVHLDSSPLYGGYNDLRFTDSFWAVVGTKNAERTLLAGFTTVRNVGSDDYNDVALMEAVDEGIIQGPRIIPATYLIGATGGHCDTTYFPPSLNQTAQGVIDGPEEGRKMVRKLKKYGAKVIKICATGGVFSNDAVGVQQLDLDEIKAIVSEAHMLGLKVAAHAHGPEGIKAAILGGVDTIEHASLVDDEGIKLAVKYGTYFGMDIYNTDYTQAEGAKNGVRESELKKDRDIGEIQRQNFCKSIKAGVKQIFSTDAGIYPHGDNAKQFAVMVRYCATPLQAIQAATLNAAAALGQEGDVGQIAVGRYGDLIGVAGDPLKDVTVLEKVAFVMKGGVTVKGP
ncbi:imidazolonepropionase-like amidohydrolase [Caulobacter ginsengisoli]|uniref:Imidazolonepropionase-like amidohydrolase n=1 Tax=Caulobacter ginsengisoli TaxID=400775 RepID=A0ABU0IWK6_9CAUL|nr:amidohydrolase family protein [Caulobacter ginsengisoli]MDQ0466402.1 imidazolonepropionase-like amidohydrolase [Caulobacter ginsengisoli]